jgi:hypothetical protein
MPSPVLQLAADPAARTCCNQPRCAPLRRACCDADQHAPLAIRAGAVANDLGACQVGCPVKHFDWVAGAL